MCTQEMSLRDSISRKFRNWNHSLGFHNLSSIGIIRIMICILVRILDLNGRKRRIDINVSLESLIGLDSIHMSIQVMPLDWSLHLSQIDVILH